MGNSAAAMQPLFEHVTPEPGCSFVWRCDDYPWKRNAWNTHPEHEIHLIRNATGVALIGDFIGRFEPGHLAVVGGGLPHHWASAVAPGDVIIRRDIVLQFDAKRLMGAAAALPELARIDAFLRRSGRGLTFHGETRRVCATLMEELGHTKGMPRLALFFDLLGRLAQSRDYRIVSSADFKPDSDDVSMGRIRALRTHILKNLAAGVTLDECAAMLQMRQSTFSRFFKKNTGDAFTDHIIRLRMARACELLATTGQPVTQICYDVGCQNLSNFNRNFRIRQGCTPTEYRRLAARRAGEPLHD